eukprot:RCo002048
MAWAHIPSWGWLSGIHFQKKDAPLRILSYTPWRALFTSLPVLPWTPWYKGTFMDGLFLWFQIVVWLAYLSILGSIDNKGAGVLRKSSSVIDLQSLVNFLLGLFVSLVLARWWTLRTLYQKNMGLCVNTARMVATYIRLPVDGYGTPEKEAAEIRIKIVRYLNLATTIACQTFSNPGGKVIRKDLGELVTDEEWELLKDHPAKFVVVYMWIASLVRWCAQVGLLSCPSATLPLLQKNISRMRGSLGDIGMYINAQLPLCYVHLLSMAIHMSLFVLANSLASVEFVQRYFTGARRFQLIFWPWFLSIMWTIAYWGLMKLQTLLENPFNFKAFGFPQEVYRLRMKELTNLMLNEMSQLPYKTPHIEAEEGSIDDLEHVVKGFRALPKTSRNIISTLEVQDEPLRILRYEATRANLLSVSLFIPWTSRYKGTFLGTPHLWVLLVFWTAVLSWLGISEDPVARTFRMPDPTDASVPVDIQPTYKDAANTLSNNFVKVQKLAIFILGLYVSLTLARWWSMRDIYQGVCNRTKDLAVMVGAYLHSPDHEEGEDTKPVQHLRMKIVRYMNLAHALILSEADGTTSGALSTLRYRGFVNDEEIRLLEPVTRNRYSVVLLWVQDLLRHCYDSQLLPNAYIFARLQKAVSRVDDAADQIINMYLDTQLPYTYIQVVSYIVQVFLFVNVCQQAFYLNEAWSQTDVQQLAGIFWPYFQIITSVVAFESFLILHIFLTNPFGKEAQHFPTERFIEELWQQTLRTIQQAPSPAMETALSSVNLASSMSLNVKPSKVVPIGESFENIHSDNFWARVMGSLMHYDPLKVYKYVPWKAHLLSIFPLIPITPGWRGTILRSTTFILQLVFWSGWLGWVGFTDNNTSQMLRLVATPSNLQNLVTFLLGMAMTLVINRWWLMREKYGSILSGSEELSLMAASLIGTPGSTKDFGGLDARIRKEVVRYCNLGQKLLVLEARRSFEKGGEPMQELLGEGLVTEIEMNALRNPQLVANRHTLVFSWLTAVLRQGSKQGRVAFPDLMLTRLSSNIGKIHRSADDVLTLLNTQLPFAYVQVLSWCVVVFLFMICCYTANKLFSGRNYVGAMQYNLYFWSFFEVNLRVSVFMGIPVMFGFFENPFTRAATSFPTEKFSRDLWKHTNECITQSQNIPRLCAPPEAKPDQAPLATKFQTFATKWYKALSGVDLFRNPLRLLRYDPWRLHFVASYVVFPSTPWWRGTFLSSGFMWVMMALGLLYISYLGFSDEPLARTLRLCSYTSTAVTTSVPCSKWSTDTVSNLQNLTNFILGLYIGLVLTRWWKIREQHQVVFGRTNDIAVL